MREKKDQHTVGSPIKPRGQQMGMAGNPDQNRVEAETTPAIRGRRPASNKMEGDGSHQQVTSDPTTPSHNAPSTPAMNVKPKSDAGGEAQFKKRLAKSRRSKSD